MSGSICNHTGYEYDITYYGDIWNLPESFNYATIEDLVYEQKQSMNNREGFVVQYEDGFRMKFKYDEYVQKHEVISYLSNRTIWESFCLGQSKIAILEFIPDELYDWTEGVILKLQMEYIAIEAACQLLFLQHKNKSRKDFAPRIAEHPNKATLFNMYSGKDYSQSIWRAIEPDKLEKATSILETLLA